LIASSIASGIEFGAATRAYAYILFKQEARKGVATEPKLTITVGAGSITCIVTGHYLYMGIKNFHI